MWSPELLSSAVQAASHRMAIAKRSNYRSNAGMPNRSKGWEMSTQQQSAQAHQANAGQLVSRRQWLQTVLAASVAAALVRPPSQAHAQAAKGGAQSAVPAPAPALFGATLTLSALGGAEIELLHWRQDFQALLVAAGPAAPTPLQTQPDLQPIRVTKLLDAATPGLQQMAHSGSASKKARLTITRDGTPWMRAELDDVTIVAFQLTSDGAAGAVETLTLAYAGAKWRLEPGLEGQLGAAHSQQGQAKDLGSPSI